VFQLTSLLGGKQSPRRPSRAPIPAASVVYLALALADLAGLHHSLIAVLGHLALSACHYREERRE
jgi:hypothetical protein